MADSRCKRRKQSNPRRKNVMPPQRSCPFPERRKGNQPRKELTDRVKEETTNQSYEVDLEVMPDDTENHTGMRSPSPTTTSRSKSPERLFIENNDSKDFDERACFQKRSRKKPEEEDKIEEYLERSDTAVVYPEPVAATVSTGLTETSNLCVGIAAVASKERRKCPHTHCTKIFSGLDAEKLMSDHLEVHSSASPKSGTNSFSCTKCNCNFADEHSISKHKLVHISNGQTIGVGGSSPSTDLSAIRKFKCPECGKAFKFKHHLKEHIRTHSGEKPFTCQNCGRRFSHSGSYSAHMTGKKCLVVNLKVRKVDSRAPKGRGPSNNAFRPIIPKYTTHMRTTATNDLSIASLGYISSSEHFPTFLSPNRRSQQSYMSLPFPEPFISVGNFSDMTDLLRDQLEKETLATKEEHPTFNCKEEKLDKSSHLELNAVKKILEIVDATVKQQNQQYQPTTDKPKNGLLQELLKTAPQSASIGEQTPDPHCRFCSKRFDSKIDCHQHQRYMCPQNSELNNLICEKNKKENSDCNSSKDSAEITNSDYHNENSESVFNVAHYRKNFKKSEILRLARDLKCSTKAVQAWFHLQQNSKDLKNGVFKENPIIDSMPSSPFNHVIPYCNGNTSSNEHSNLSNGQNIHSTYSDDQPLDLSLKTKNEKNKLTPISNTEALNLSQKSSRNTNSPKDTYHFYHPEVGQTEEFSNEKGGKSNEKQLPNLHSSLLYKYMQIGFSSSTFDENQNLNAPIAAITPSPDKSPNPSEGPCALPSPDVASSADICCSPAETSESYMNIDENNETDNERINPTSRKRKFRDWNQGEDESTLFDERNSPGAEEDSLGGSGKIRKSWKIHKVESEEGLYACDQCDKMFSKQSSLARHKYEHSGQRPHKCDVCCKAFKHKHHLTEHKRLHSGEKPYQCIKCLKRFSHSGSYSQHMNHRFNYCKPYHE